MAMNSRLLLLVVVWQCVKSQNMSEYTTSHHGNNTIKWTATTSLQNNNSSPAVHDLHDLSVVGKVCISVFGGCVSSATISGNVLIIVAFAQERKLQILNNYLLVSLAVADATVGAFSMPFIIMIFVQGYWNLGRHICDIFLLVDYMVNASSIAHIFLICVDRYLAFALPFRYRQIRNKRLLLLMIAGAWVFSLLFSVPWVYVWPYTQNVRQRSDTECHLVVFENKYIAVFSNSVVVFIPAIVMVVLYYKILKIARKSARFKKCLKQRTDERESSQSSLKNNANNTSSNGCCSGLHTLIDRSKSQKESGNETIEVTEPELHIGNEDEIKKEDDLAVRQATRIQRHRDNRILKILGAVLITFIITWMPFNSATTLHPFCENCIPPAIWLFLKLIRQSLLLRSLQLGLQKGVQEDTLL
ncbi:muscarinic acetylcholine receptor M4-like isoform X2 [Mya arenaria]|uniref:muscarinic acetylcholine receptor M4-like isoform X2 n=1 Tax=Mya arenaria TaxID=6604 RepID=UPI0022E69449|nr:muscarinic acetylcholine receptor M4-like isoform X2 [Mya arenaria]